MIHVSLTMSEGPSGFFWADPELGPVALWLLCLRLCIMWDRCLRPQAMICCTRPQAMSSTPSRPLRFWGPLLCSVSLPVAVLQLHCWSHDWILSSLSRMIRVNGVGEGPVRHGVSMLEQVLACGCILGPPFDLWLEFELGPQIASKSSPEESLPSLIRTPQEWQFRWCPSGP